MTLSKEQILEIALKHGMDAEEDSIELNESGLDFQVAFIRNRENEKWVLRFPRRKDVIPTAKKEKNILDFVGPQISVEAPKWDIFTNELIAYKLLKGIPAATIDPEKQAYVWQMDAKNVPYTYHESLGKAMAQLHQIEHQAAKKAGIFVQTPEEIRTSMQRRMNKVKERFGISGELWDRWQKWLHDDSLWPHQTALIHGEIHPGHILIDQNFSVTGLIDWTEAHVGDPAKDFVVHLMVFGENALKELIKSYEKAGGYVWPSMFEHIVELQSANPVEIAEFAVRSGLKEYEEMARQMLGINNA